MNEAGSWWPTNLACLVFGVFPKSSFVLFCFLLLSNSKSCKITSSSEGDERKKQQTIVVQFRAVALIANYLPTFEGKAIKVS